MRGKKKNEAKKKREGAILYGGKSKGREGERNMKSTGKHGGESVLAVGDENSRNNMVIVIRPLFRLAIRSLNYILLRMCHSFVSYAFILWVLVLVLLVSLFFKKKKNL